MRTDRRGFMRVLMGALGFLTGGASPAAAEPWTQAIHRATRNTLFGAVGSKLWRTSRPRDRTKTYAGAPRIALPKPVATDARSLSDVLTRFGDSLPGVSDEPITVSELARLLHFANGVTGRRGSGGQTVALRAAPSAGALYSGELYIVAERVRGLDPGVYYYAPLDHALARLRAGSSRDVLRSAVERPDGIADAPAVVLLSNVFARYGWRYANRGYRYALIDSGHIGENLRLAARSTGLVDVSPLRFHDDLLNARLGIDGQAEAVCALHFVGRPPRRARALARPPAQHFAEQQAVSPEKVPTSGPITERYHAATKLVPAQGAAIEASIPPAPAPVRAGLHPDMSVEECILRRRSADAFRSEPLTRQAFDWILQAAVGQPTLVRAPGVELVLAVHRVAGVAPGLYRFDRGGAGLSLVRAGDLRRPLVTACLGQTKAGSCAVAFFGVGQLGRAAARGDRTYRDLLIEAGAIGQRIYLAAEAAGLAARNLAAFRDDELNDLLELDGREVAAVHLTLAGHEPLAASR